LDNWDGGFEISDSRSHVSSLEVSNCLLNIWDEFLNIGNAFWKTTNLEFVVGAGDILAVSQCFLDNWNSCLNIGNSSSNISSLEVSNSFLYIWDNLFNISNALHKSTNSWESFLL
jgi:hypothetical protein